MAKKQLKINFSFLKLILRPGVSTDTTDYDPPHNFFFKKFQIKQFNFTFF